MTAVITGVSHFDHRQWTFIIILAQVVKPWAQPLAKLLWERFIDTLKTNIIKLLDRGKSVACNVMLRAVTRLVELRESLAPLASIKLSTAASESSDNVKAVIDTAPVHACIATHDVKPVITDTTAANACNTTLTSGNSNGMIMMLGSSSTGSKRT